MRVSIYFIAIRNATVWKLIFINNPLIYFFPLPTSAAQDTWLLKQLLSVFPNHKLDILHYIYVERETNDTACLVLVLFDNTKSLKEFKCGKKSLNWQNGLTSSHQCLGAAWRFPFYTLHRKFEGVARIKAKFKRSLVFTCTVFLHWAFSSLDLGGTKSRLLVLLTAMGAIVEIPFSVESWRIFFFFLFERKRWHVRIFSFKE